MKAKTTPYRKEAADLARDIRRMPRKGDWTTREWNKQVRITVRHYMDNMIRFQLMNRVL